MLIYPLIISWYTSQITLTVNEIDGVSVCRVVSVHLIVGQPHKLVATVRLQEVESLRKKKIESVKVFH